MFEGPPQRVYGVPQACFSEEYPVFKASHTVFPGPRSVPTGALNKFPEMLAAVFRNIRNCISGR